MLKKILVVRDAKVGAYLSPIFVRSIGEGLRSFQDAVNDKNTDFFKHAEDFMLFEIGEYDDSTGELIPLAQPNVVAKAVDLLAA